MTQTELKSALQWVGEHFFWILPSDEAAGTVEKIIETAGQLCLRRGIHGLVIDPWNELEPMCRNE
jgi:twinkle protein